LGSPTIPALSITIKKYLTSVRISKAKPGLLIDYSLPIILGQELFGGWNPEPFAEQYQVQVRVQDQESLQVQVQEVQEKVQEMVNPVQVLDAVKSVRYRGFGGQDWD